MVDYYTPELTFGKYESGMAIDLNNSNNNFRTIWRTGGGPELNTDIGFDNPGQWTITGVSYSIAGGIATGLGVNGFLFQSSASIITGNIYYYKLTLITRSAGSLIFYVGNAGTSTSPAFTIPGTYVGFITANSPGEFGFKNSDGFTGTFDNLYLRDAGNP